MILEGCQTIQWRRHFDPPPPLSILPFPFLPSFFSSLLPSEFSVRRASGSKGFEGIRRLVLYSIPVPESTFDEPLPSPPLPPLIAVKYRFQDFVRVSTGSTFEWRGIFSRVFEYQILFERFLQTFG